MLTLASTSAARRALLTNAAVAHVVVAPRVDEAAVKDALLAEGHPPRAVADALAELKALKPRVEGLVLGSDQVVSHEGALLSKPADRAGAVAMLSRLRGGRHKLHAAAAIAEDGRIVWRHVAEVTMVMRAASDAYLEGYVARNWEAIRHCAGSYALEGEGARLFHAVQGDMFAVLGLPLLPVLDYLATRGEIEV